MFILELTHRSWAHSEENKRRTLQRNDIAAAITRTDIFDFLARPLLAWICNVILISSCFMRWKRSLLCYIHIATARAWYRARLIFHEGWLAG